MHCFFDGSLMEQRLQLTFFSQPLCCCRSDTAFVADDLLWAQAPLGITSLGSELASATVNEQSPVELKRL